MINRVRVAKGSRHVVIEELQGGDVAQAYISSQTARTFAHQLLLAADVAEYGEHLLIEVYDYKDDIT